MAEDQRGRQGAAVEVATEAGASAVAAAVGLIGGPIGAIIGAALAPGLTRLGRVGLAWIAARQEAVVGLARDAVGGEDQLISELENRPELIALLLKTMSAAVEAELDTHLRALAAVLRDGATSAIPIREAKDLVAAIAALTTESVVVLEYLSTEPTEHEGYHVDITVAEQLGYSRATVRTALRHLEDVEAVTTIGGLIGGGEGWHAEPRAAQILDYLREATARRVRPRIS